ncbi:response regulator transcription factor [Kosakonia sp.]|uniref:response regulator transcription factor n=1 Tax=Kosakonia sp. TaxID=1916651 RepID=UPI0028AC0BE0|nr:response regulator transcription factor [Kosakonia sp.]
MHIFMIDKHSIYIEEMTSVVSHSIPEVKICGLNDCKKINETLGKFPASLIILDGNDNKKACIELIDNLSQHYPGIPVVMLINKCQLISLRQFLNHHAIAFVRRDSPPETITQTLHTASAGMLSFPHENMTVLDNNHRTLACLSERQREILKLLAAGESNKQISRLLNISPGTVKTHLESIFRRLNVTNRTQAAMMYFKEN